MEDKNAPTWRGYLICFLMAASKMLRVILTVRTNFFGHAFAIRIKSAIVNTVYKKVCKEISFYLHMFCANSDLYLRLLSFLLSAHHGLMCDRCLHWLWSVTQDPYVCAQQVSYHDTVSCFVPPVHSCSFHLWNLVSEFSLQSVGHFKTEFSLNSFLLVGQNLCFEKVNPLTAFRWAAFCCIVLTCHSILSRIFT